MNREDLVRTRRKLWEEMKQQEASCIAQIDILWGTLLAMVERDLKEYFKENLVCGEKYIFEGVESNPRGSKPSVAVYLSFPDGEFLDENFEDDKSLRDFFTALKIKYSLGRLGVPSHFYSK